MSDWIWVLVALVVLFVDIKCTRGLMMIYGFAWPHCQMRKLALIPLGGLAGLVIYLLGRKR